MRHPLTSHRVFGLIVGAVLALGTACSSGTEPGGGPTLTRVGGDDQQGLIETQLGTPLAVRVTDAAGAPVAGTTVTWVVTSGGGSVSPASSTTDGNGVATTIWTLGSLPGEQRVTATVAGGGSATFTANASTVSGCASPLTLGPGGMCLASPAQLVSLNVGAGSSASEFVVIPYNDANFGRTTTQVDATATGAIGVTGPPTPTVIPSQDAGVLGSTNLLARDYGFERRLRQRERSALGPLVGAGRSSGSGAPAAFNVVPAPPVFAIGDQMTLNTNEKDACSSPVMKTAIVRAQSANAIIVEDTQNPAGFSAADYDEILANFENVVRPSNIEAFGGHTDIDNNQRILIFYTIEVNKLTSVGSTSYVGGFFFSRDLFPKSGSELTPSGKTLSGCAGSNFAEIFYMLSPDPAGCFTASGQCSSQNIRTVDFVKLTTAGTIAHEYQHLINASRRLRITPNAAFPEAVWLDEGLSHIAEELAYYRATGYQPRQNLNLDDIRASQPLQRLFDTYQNANMARYNQYVRRTNTHSPYGETPQSGQSAPPDWDDLETRGAIWSFLRWAADHRGSSDGDAWQRLVRDATVSGADNLRAVFGTAIGSRFREWAGATYLDDAPGMPQPDYTFRQPSWNFRSILPAYTSNNGSFPLQVFVIGTNSTVFNLVDGGAAYLRFGVAANSTANVRVTTVGGGQLPSGTSAWIVRTK